MSERFNPRCYLIEAVAPSALRAREANDALNAYIDDRRRGLVVWHDHFVGSPHGGVAIIDVRSDAEGAMLADAGPLAEWQLKIRPLTFSLSAVGFIEQAHLTLHEYAKTTLEELRQAEPQDRRFWWQRRRE